MFHIFNINLLLFVLMTYLISFKGYASDDLQIDLPIIKVQRVDSLYFISLYVEYFKQNNTSDSTEYSNKGNIVKLLKSLQSYLIGEDKNSETYKLFEEIKILKFRNLAPIKRFFKAVKFVQGLGDLYFSPKIYPKEVQSHLEIIFNYIKEVYPENDFQHLPSLEGFHNHRLQFVNKDIELVKITDVIISYLINHLIQEFSSIFFPEACIQSKKDLIHFLSHTLNISDEELINIVSTTPDIIDLDLLSYLLMLDHYSSVLSLVKAEFSKDHFLGFMALKKWMQVMLSSLVSSNFNYTSTLYKKEISKAISNQISSGWIAISSINIYSFKDIFKDSSEHLFPEIYTQDNDNSTLDDTQNGINPKQSLLSFFESDFIYPLILFIKEIIGRDSEIFKRYKLLRSDDSLKGFYDDLSLKILLNAISWIEQKWLTFNNDLPDMFALENSQNHIWALFKKNIGGMVNVLMSFKFESNERKLFLTPLFMNLSSELLLPLELPLFKFLERFRTDKALELYEKYWRNILSQYTGNFIEIKSKNLEEIGQRQLFFLSKKHSLDKNRHIEELVLKAFQHYDLSNIRNNRWSEIQFLMLERLVDLLNEFNFLDNLIRIKDIHSEISLDDMIQSKDLHALDQLEFVLDFVKNFTFKEKRIPLVKIIFDDYSNHYLDPLKIGNSLSLVVNHSNDLILKIDLLKRIIFFIKRILSKHKIQFPFKENDFMQFTLVYLIKVFENVSKELNFHIHNIASRDISDFPVFDEQELNSIRKIVSSYMSSQLYDKKNSINRRDNEVATEDLIRYSSDNDNSTNRSLDILVPSGIDPRCPFS